jgi:predicted NBD/HSP70 family sugar kinase
MTEKDRAILAAGLGGTHLTAAVVNDGNRIVWDRTVPSPCGGELIERARRAPDKIGFTLEHWDELVPFREGLLDAAAELLDEARSEAVSAGYRTDRAGVGLAGAVNPITGRIVEKAGALNHPAWGDFHPGRSLERRTGFPVTCLNDGKAMALGALATFDRAAVLFRRTGSGLTEIPLADALPGCRGRGEITEIADFIEIDPGTGLGGAYIVDGSVWYGPDSRNPDPDVGEIWHLEVDGERLGERFEEMVSGRAIGDAVLSGAQALGDARTMEILAERGGKIQNLLAAGHAPLDAVIADVLFTAGSVIGKGIVHFSGSERRRLKAPDIRTFVIGGGIVSGDAPESTFVRKTLQEGILSIVEEKQGMADKPRVIFTTLGGRALLIGAAHAARIAG